MAYSIVLDIPDLTSTPPYFPSAFPAERLQSSSPQTLQDAVADSTPRRSLPEQPASTTSTTSSTVRPVPTSRVLGRRRRSIGDITGDSENNNGQDNDKDNDTDKDNERKRIKLDKLDMLGQTVNGHGSTSNGKEKANGARAPSNSTSSSSSDSNSHPHQHTHPTSNSTLYFGHDREEVTRLVIQTLSDLGYDDAADSVMQTSGYALESPAVASFRAAVLAADWDTAEHHLRAATVAGRSERQDRPERSETDGNGRDGLVLSPEANLTALRFAIREQKYLEYLEQGDTAKGLLVLRNELTPLCLDTSNLHRLSSLLMCQNPGDLFGMARWDGAAGTSRQSLLSRLSRFISPSVMLPEHRLAVLLQEVKYYQNSACLYHTNPSGSSLYTDHYCEPTNFPSHLLRELDDGLSTLEVWQIRFSNDGSKLASCGSGRHVIIWDMKTFKVLLKLDGHAMGAGDIAWSPDDSMLVSCGRDNTVRIFDTHTGLLRNYIDKFSEPISCCAWVAPSIGAGDETDNSNHSIVLGSFDKTRGLCTWSLDGELLHTWTEKHRTEDMALSSNGQWLVAMDHDKNLHVYNFRKRELEYEMPLQNRPVSVEISQNDPNMLLVNRQDGEVHMFDLMARGRFVRRYIGSTGGDYIIRGAFGGANECFVISGSEDGNLTIWHKNIGSPLFKMEAHKPRCNAVRWSPTDPVLFASCGDDAKIKIWSNAERVRQYEAMEADVASANGSNGFLV
ncbi:wd domain-containing protein [Ophiostoma piceae UAMH 11346]|uniref:Wd domain-containing protein n=1 Tax=Ophiostoma piceae (strain UAMH 11346) TaxID=1262450 RepID=S3C537_OPHP1|nr:wd domain-containing protein [Ophiostoma piceae UAMH 11346]